MTLKQFVQRRSLLSLCSVQLVFATIMLKLWSYFWAKYLSKQGRRNRQMELSSSNEPIELNRAFWRRFFPLLRICIPSVFSREFLGVFMLTSLFLVRTKLTILMARTLGRNSKYLVQGDMKSFFAGIGDVALLSIPGAVSKVGAQYAKIMVQQLFRENLQRQLQEEYLRGNNIYAIATMNALDNPDHRITQTTRDFCNGLTDLLRSVLKPMADAITLTFALAHTGGFAPPAVVLSYYGFVATMMSTLLPNFAHLVAVSQEREGNYRTSHHQMIVHAEEVAFYGGEDVEREHADGLLRSITKHESFMKKVKVWSGIMDSLLIQYGATCIGYVVCGAVTLDQKANLSTPDLTELYVRSTHLYIPLSLAVGKLLLLHKKVAALCSSTHRVGEFRELLLNLSESGVESMENYKITDSNEIKFCNADIAIPSGRYVLKNFNLTITPGKHILVMGSNGSGKSALIRALTRLWPLRTGELYLPADEGSILVLPQRVFLTVGTLRSQMLYPLTEAEAAAKGICDDDLRDYANSLGLAQVLERAGGLSAVNNWHEVLSGGERQRVALVRVLVQQPVFAFLDECTSAVSQADEPMLYARLQKAGVTLISISHREALKALHTELLELDGQGGYRVTSLLKDLPRTTSMSPSMNNAMDGEKV